MTIKFLLLKTTFSLLTFVFILCMFPFLKLAFTETKVVKFIVGDIYLVKISSNEYDFTVFSDYMKNNGWNETNRLGGLHVFEKNGVKKEILQTQIKTVMIDGKLNFPH